MFELGKMSRLCKFEIDAQYFFRVKVLRQDPTKRKMYDLTTQATMDYGIKSEAFDYFLNKWFRQRCPTCNGYGHTEQKVVSHDT
ncbi:MAG: hypothetical protein KGI08_08630 [Thaumarchaeota archaeon]|nr:hypothetical protein [Nitrososphaerota archaeon]